MNLLRNETKTFSGHHRMPFGVHTGRTLDEISELNGQYILWLAENNVLKIDQEFLDAVEMSEREAESEMRDIITEYWYD